MPRVLVVLVFLVLADLSRASLTFAAPLTLADGDQFEVTLPDTPRTCLAQPGRPLDPVGCKGLQRLPELAPESDRGRTFATGLLWRGNGLVAVTAMLAKEPRSAPMDRGQATAFAGGMADAASKQFAGVHPHYKPDVRIIDAGGLPVVRIRYDLDGLPTDMQFVQHTAALAVASEAGDYAIAFRTTAANAAEADALADSVLSTLTVRHPARPGASKAYLVGRAIGFLSVVALATVFGIVVAIRATRRRRPSATAG